MEVNNGIIIDGVLHELISIQRSVPCDNCSLQNICSRTDFFLCTLVAGRHSTSERFVNCGKVKVEKK